MGGIQQQELNVDKIRKDFPILERFVREKKLVYLDNAATAQKPLQVINALADYYTKYNSNVHRAVHTLSAEASEAYDDARQKIAGFINAKFGEIIFVKNGSEAANIVLHSLVLDKFRPGDEIISTVMEHHSNIVPWQLAQKKGIKLKFVDIDDKGQLRMEQFDELVTERTKLVTVAHASNVLGTINPVEEIGRIAHDAGAFFMIDAAQSVPHMPFDAKKIDCDFATFSGHKMLAPTGTGCLYGKEALLEDMEPFLRGSDMIREVKLFESTWNGLPYKFETGTPNIADSIAFGVAVDYLNALGMQNVWGHEQNLVNYAMKRLSEIKGLVIYGPQERGGVISFNLGDVHSHDLASVLDEQGIAVRSGHHCAMPLMTRLGITAATRASFYIYNTKEEIDKLAEALEQARSVFKLK